MEIRHRVPKDGELLAKGVTVVVDDDETDRELGGGIERARRQSMG